ncbi:TPA: restriction endonuclease subunit S [Vibrio parahaemolyticus]|uniref:restriction endonuclease subunit S n=1 Tax=Vibrio parahaemolyticus TaxID=670 RepID=UPI001122A8F2|nr:restriction endonuclease subunit S [Vibrio parahaemolyticus]EGQ9921350.1 restriction endonuclease subunit S [Vibrio parahaemolyticus]MDF4361648.1 restriction endonuclease subunit S [Vibrio parahaemolyticus]MDF4543248.1 restriction endonuclease subunit S [Vibrio parahaemolyticus]MDG2577986.1 restriction endonuclease subunit S [Vibrio parahaemolyticus]MDG2797207.1 restriction endonuclease subunit S [Vibrio parahaemolyticus]
MNDFEKELAQISQDAAEEPEVKLPSLEEQKAIAAELKKLEAEGKLTPEILEQYFGKFNKKNSVPIH